MIFTLILAFIISMYINLTPQLYEDDGIYQINKLEYSYTSGYGLNTDTLYEIDCEDECILSIKEYGKDKNDIITIKLTNKNMDKFEKILNKNHILSWSGFNKSDRDVLDGNSFSFRLRYNDDEKLSASGYMKYPDYYKDFRTEFENYVNELKK